MARENNSRHHRRPMAAARDEAQDMVEEKVDQAKEMFSDARDKAGEVWDDTKDHVRKSAGRVQDYAEQNPWQVAAISAGIGLLLGALIARRRD